MAKKLIRLVRTLRRDSIAELVRRIAAALHQRVGSRIRPGPDASPAPSSSSTAPLTAPSSSPVSPVDPVVPPPADPPPVAPMPVVPPAVDLRPKLATLAASLAALAKRTDPDFSQLAADLKSLHAGAFELSRGIGKHAGAAQELLQSSRLGGPDGAAARSLAGLQSGMDAATANLDALREVAASLGRLHSQGGQIERIAMILKSSGCTFAVESARSATCQQAFGSFVEELRGLAGKITDLGQAIGGQARETQGRLEQVTASTSGNLDQLRQLTRHSESSVRQTTEQMQRLLDSSADTLVAAESRTRQITRHADDIVFHIQFGDIVRQQLEHIVSSLEDAAAALDSGAPNAQDKTAVILDIQLAQIDAIAGEVGKTHRELSEGFGGLGEESRLLAESVRHLDASGADGGRGRDVFSDLKTELARLEDLQGQGQTLCARANESSQQAIASAAGLSRHLDQIQDINREMHLQALNAIIKTALLGDEGRTLEVLSSHVHMVFQESSVLVDQTIQTLGHVHTLANGTRESAVGGQTDAGADLQHSLSQIGKVNGEFHAVTGIALQLVEKQESRLQEVRERLGFLEALANGLAAFRAEVQPLRQSLPEPKAESVSDDDLLSLTRRYTMESERIAHRRATGKPEADSMTRSTQPAVATEDNFDFFDDPRPAPETATTGPAAKANKDSDFGDNIDLF